MDILITGANGFLGHYLCEELLSGGHQVLATGRGPCRLPFSGQAGFSYIELDFTDPFAVHDVFESYAPAVVVHAGALTKVDECEQQQWETYLVNVEGTVTVLLNAAEQKSFFIFVSTDFVFPGDRGHYKEEDQPGPVNFYGKTKMEGEETVREYEYDWAIVRTSLVYGKPLGGKPNILSVVKDKLQKGETYNVVDDQVRTPTYAGDLAKGIASIIRKRATGIFHVSGADVLTPYQVACMAGEEWGLDTSLLQRVTSATFTQPATRPPRTNLLIDKARAELDYAPLSFREGLKKTSAPGND